MKEFFQMMRRFISPYKKYVIGAVGLNLLSAVFNVFSFSLLIPILNILFKTGDSEKVYHFMEWGSGELKDVAVNNFYYYVSQSVSTRYWIKYRYCADRLGFNLPSLLPKLVFICFL